jgi:hypothetical protein
LDGALKKVLVVADEGLQIRARAESGVDIERRQPGIKMKPAIGS